MNENKTKKILKADIDNDKMDRIGIEMEVSSVDFKIQLIKKIYKFLQMMTEDSLEGKQFFRGDIKNIRLGLNGKSGKDY